MRTAVVTLLAIPALSAFTGAEGSASASESCGITPEVVPAFELEDVNPTSATYGQKVRRDDHLGQVIVIYWAQAT